MNPNVSANASVTQVQSVNATSGGLIKATLGAAVVAAAILTFAWLPAEHGIDPTGVGHLLGLTEMGRIKEQLHAEADADAAATVSSTQSDTTVLEINQKLAAIQLQLTAITAELAKAQANNKETTVQASDKLEAENTVQTVAWTDEVSYTLSPGEGVEVKLVMEKGATAEFEWSANGAVLNHDTHGDGSGESISYEKGRGVPEQAGELTAAFTGNHGWFWRNRTEQDVVMTLRTRGDYTGMVLP